MPASRAISVGDLGGYLDEWRTHLESENKAAQTIQSSTEAVDQLIAFLAENNLPLAEGGQARHPSHGYRRRPPHGQDVLQRRRPLRGPPGRRQPPHLLETAVRLEEQATMILDVLDLKSRRIKVLGKGDKERCVKIGPRTALVVSRYLRIPEGFVAHRRERLGHSPVVRDGGRIIGEAWRVGFKGTMTPSGIGHVPVDAG